MGDFMKKPIFSVVLLALVFLLPLMTTNVVSLSSQGSIHRLDAKGGIPGPPERPPPDEEPPDEVPIEYELFIEIDYIEGHMPTDAVLTYIADYYNARGIAVTYLPGDLIENGDLPLSVDPTNGISDSEFWAIEAIFNDGSDKASDGIDADLDGYYDEEFFLKEKWVLFGTAVEGAPNTVGYCYVLIGYKNPAKADLFAGNYIFIADEAADTWEDINGIEFSGAEAVVLMHEMGHSIGIGILDVRGEVYDRDTYSVMSYLNVNNAGLYDNWYYSDKYWSTRNMEYYSI